MGKILGIAAAILLCAATASAGERGVFANTGPSSVTKNAQEVAIGVQVDNTLTSVAGNNGVIFNQTACVRHNDDAVTTAGDIGQWLDRVAIFMESGEKNPYSEGSDFVLIMMRSNSLASSVAANGSGMAPTEVFPLGDTKILKGPHSTAFIHTGQNTVFC